MFDIAAGIVLNAALADALGTPAPVAMVMPGFGELWPILIIVLLLFGGRKLPELARAAGSSITQFKRGLKDEEKVEPIEGPGKDAAEKETT